MNKSNYIALLFGVIATFGVARADTYLNVYGLSKHLDTLVKFNESNYGVGMTEELSNLCSITIGMYENSLGNSTTFATYDVRWELHRLLDIGVSAGMATGYNYPLVPVAYPFVKAGVFKAGYIPKIEGATPTVVFASFSFKIN